MAGHNGLGAGFYCPSCPSQEAFVDYATDKDGCLSGFLLTCTKCGEIWTEPR